MGRVLPGITRTYDGDATVDWPLGATYDVEVAMGLPDDTGAMGDPVFRETFQADATPVLEARLPRPSARTSTEGRPSTATLVNGGSLGIVPLVGFEVFDEAGARVGAAPASEQPLAWPDSSVDATVDLADPLPAGRIHARRHRPVRRRLPGRDTSPLHHRRRSPDRGATLRRRHADAVTESLRRVP